MIKVFEAFAGYGSSCFALKELGVAHELVGFSEIDKYAIQCFEQNHGGKNFGDIIKIDWSQVPDFDLLTGGFPCQSFSTAGNGLGEQDKRGQLGLELTRALKQKQPKYFLFENVKGFMSKRFTETRKKFISSWEEAGYNVVYKVLNTKNYNVPQNRERVWFVGIRKDISQKFEFPEPFELKLKLNDILEDNIEGYCYQKSHERNFGSKGKLCSGVCDTLTQSMGTGGGNVPVVAEKYYLKQEQVNKINNSSFVSRRGLIQRKEICSSLMARDFKEPKCVDFLKVRRLTPKEYFRLQGFLDDQIKLEYLSNTQCYKLAGNGQSINVVKLLLNELLKEINNKKQGGGNGCD